jgi:hypothetical protein
MNELNVLNRIKLYTFIRALGKTIFNITWIKKDGSIRNANVRQGVKLIRKSKRISVVSKPSEAYLLLYLMPNMQGNTFLYETGFRLVNLSTITQITTKGISHQITPEPIVQTFDLNMSDFESPNNLYELKDEIRALTV